jgi:hypothetical protein
MSECNRYKKDWLAFINGELEPSRIREMSGHLEKCSACRQELEQTKKLLSLADGFRDELKQVMATVDWENLPGAITEKVREKQEQQIRAGSSGWQVRWKWQPLTAGLVLGLLLGMALTFLVLKPQKPDLMTARGDSRISLPADFVERVDLNLARRETLDYLERSQYLLLELLQTGQGQEPAGLLQRDKIQKLLTDKKYLNIQLDDLRLLKAKAICDQIEFLFLELTQLSPELTAAELETVRNMIEEKQLLLKINLVKKELQQSEV